jgi:hypothetical protein
MVGGACRGYNRALRVSGQYVMACFVVGLAFILLLSLWQGTPELIPILFVIQFYGCLCIFVMSMVANLVFVRIFKKRTWRNEKWRKWVAGGTGVALTWGGMLLLAITGSRPSEILQRLLGGMAEVVHHTGWFVLLSNLGLLVGWMIPSRRPPGGGRGDAC